MHPIVIPTLSLYNIMSLNCILYICRVHAPAVQTCVKWLHSNIMCVCVRNVAKTTIFNLRVLIRPCEGVLYMRRQRKWVGGWCGVDYMMMPPLKYSLTSVFGEVLCVRCIVSHIRRLHPK